MKEHGKQLGARSAAAEGKTVNGPSQTGMDRNLGPNIRPVEVGDGILLQQT